MVNQIDGQDKPTLSINELEGLAADSLPASNVVASKREKKQKGWSALILEQAADDELFHDEEGKGYAWTNGQRFIPLRSKAYRSEIISRAYSTTGGAPSSQATEEALRALEAKAQITGLGCTPRVRYAKSEGGILIDCGSDKWNCVKITAGSIKVGQHPEAVFIRKRGMKSLPEPASISHAEANAALNEFRTLLGIEEENSWILLCSWLMGALRPAGPYPILIVTSEQGSGKSSLCRYLRALIDPCVAGVRSTPKDERDLVIWAANGHLIILDNLSTLPDWLSDALCRVSTGGGLATRELYADSEEVLFDFQRPIVMNGISDFANRNDLLDRSILISLPVIAEDKRRTEEDLNANFERLRPAILTALYAAASQALSILPTLRPEKLPRLADFALWAIASEKALGFEVGSFTAAYEANRKDITALSLESSTVAQAVLSFCSFSGSWEGTPKELLKRLNGLAEEGSSKATGWPQSAQALSTQLRRIAPALRRLGVEVSFRRSHERLVRVETKTP